ncbi:MAG: hypothetical protein KDD15_09675 [Lewinella sp.]|nr:hypothetical protein [Lewinella sp.]
MATKHLYLTRRYTAVLLPGSLFLLVGFLACQPKMYPPVTTHEEEAPQRSIRRIDLLSLRALDISENATTFSTQDDEILFLSYLLEKDADSLRVIDQKMFRDLTFDSSKTVYDLPYTLEPDPQSREYSVAAFLLVELDNTGTEDSIMEVYNRALRRFPDAVAPRRLTLDTLIGMDDFLGIHFIRYDQPYEAGTQELIFKGVQLFDRFEYRLSYRMEAAAN